MKGLAVCLSVLFALAVPGISWADPDLSGTWALEITRVDQSGTVVSVPAIMVLAPGSSPGFYFGTVTGDAHYITVVQQGGDITFTIACDSGTEGCTTGPTGFRTRTWGSGIASRDRLQVRWSDDIGLTGTGQAVRE